MDSVHHIWCPLSSQEFQDLPDGAETTLTLEQHYGLTLNDTPFSDETVIKEHIDAGIPLADAVNFLVDKYALVRIDRRGLSWQEQSSYLRLVDTQRTIKVIELWLFGVMM
ncbi:hypothetical protein MS5380_50490 [Klebsiella pneumoniae]|nr:hypothetical protein MS5380_50490 [Klebsiella pneumoniae]